MNQPNTKPTKPTKPARPRIPLLATRLHWCWARWRHMMSQNATRCHTMSYDVIRCHMIAYDGIWWHMVAHDGISAFKIPIFTHIFPDSWKILWRLCPVLLIDMRYDRKLNGFRRPTISSCFDYLHKFSNDQRHLFLSYSVMAKKPENTLEEGAPKT